MPKNKSQSNPASEDYVESEILVVGIGASAGGIQALTRFFENVKADARIAYVVILHLSPDHDSRLAHVLQQVTELPVEQVTKKTKIRANHVYVVPPDKSLSMSDGYIVVKAIKTVEERRAPVDIFFRTLAETHGANCVGVILSGTGANGSMGLKRIKEFGGATFVQNPREAEFNEMPRNSIATEFVDMILPVAEIPVHIIRYRDRLGMVSIPVDPTDRQEDDQNSLREIFTHLRIRTGHDFSNYKRPTMLRRIERRISVRGLDGLPAYAEYLRGYPEESNALLKDLLISVTNFFRDKKAFDAIEKNILPKLVSIAYPTKPIRIWVAGCATGEEAYSIAMLATELSPGGIDGPPIQIFATDIDEQAIAFAREGIYTLNDAADVSPDRMLRFFTKEGDKYRVRREIREMILFAQHNLIKDPPFSHLDMISCRNLLIYLNHAAQERVMETAHFALKPGGYLFVGSSESVDGSQDLFTPVDKVNHIFQSRQVTARMFPIPDSTPGYRERITDITKGTAAHSGNLERITYNDLHLKLIEHLAPPSVVINADHEIVHSSESAGKYMVVAGGEPTNNLLRMIRPEIRLELRTALFQASQQKANVEVKNLLVKLNGHTENINLLVRPVTDEENTSRGFILVVFEPSIEGVAQPAADYASPEPVAQQLEEELVRFRKQLQSSLEQSEIQAEELRASNEELQAMNEELRSSAEELETSKEELQSINEELSTVNQELKIKIEEQSHTNDNFINLLNSIDIAVIFLDRGLKVNLFSPAAGRIFNLRAGDVGRPLSDITNRLLYDALSSDAENVLEKLQTVEQEIETDDGNVFAMRILPYRTTEDRINGVVLTFVDVTKRKHTEEDLGRSASILSGQKEAFQAAINASDYAASLEPLINAGLEHFGEDARAAFHAISDDGKTLQHVAGMSETYTPDLGESGIQTTSLACGLAFAAGEPVITPDIEKDKRWKDWRKTARTHGYRSCWSFPVSVTSGPALGAFVLYFTNPREPDERDLEIITALTHSAAIVISRQKEASERARVQRELQRSEVKYRTLFDSIDEGFCIMEASQEADGRVGDAYFREVNPSFERHTGLKGVVDKAVSEVLPEFKAKWLDIFNEVVKTGKPNRTEDYVSTLDRWYSVYFSRLGPAGSTLVAVVFNDITARKKAEEALAESEERFRGLIESFAEAVWETNAEGRVVKDSPSWRMFTGQSFEQWEGDGWLDAVHSEDRDFAEQQWRESVASGQNANAEFRLRRESGDYRWTNVRAIPLKDSAGTIRKWVGMNIDVHARKTAQSEMQESEERYRMIADSVSEYAIIAMDKDRVITSWNTGAENIFGWPEKEAIGLTGDIIFTPEDRAAGVPDREMATAVTQGRAPDERFHLRKDRSRFFVSGVMTPLRNSRGELRGFVKVARDMTGVQAAEKALRDRETLQKLIAVQEDERKRMARDLHDELGQELTVLRLRLENLDPTANADDLEERIKEIRGMVSSVDQGVDQIAWELRPQALDDFGLLSALEKYVKRWSFYSGIKIELIGSTLKNERFSPEIETNLYRIVQEALNNVTKHSKAQNVEIMFDRREDDLVLVVEDDGKGFNPRRKKPIISGLGLVGMRERAELIGGKFQIESTPKKGTTIYVTVPVGAG